MTVVTDIPKYKLNNGILMPQLGLGTWQAEDGDETVEAIRSALDIGYRLIDTAAIYGNEESAGRAIEESGLKREDIFVTTKLWNDSHDFDRALRAYDDSLARLGLDYADLYLIHWPVPAQDKFTEAWRALEKLYEDKRVRAIGVSNFKPTHLDNLLASAQVVPAINQIELHPRLQQLETRRYCADNGIQVESYSPLQRAGELLKDETLQRLADKHDVTRAQVVLRWHIQEGLVVIPKSTHRERQRENFDIFDFVLDKDDMTAIRGMNKETRVLHDPDEANFT
jgi:diketogulonate reductase-like aldo/keto reductase